MDPIQIYQNLKEKIIWLDINPGSALNLVELADSYGVSRNPLTIALTRLDAEEWVVRQGSHYVVSPLTLDRIREITEIRSVLEVRANLWAMNRLTPDGRSALKNLRNEIRNLDKGAGNRQIVQLDVKLHRLLYREAQNNQLAVLLERMLSHYLRFWLSAPRDINTASFFNEAVEIIKAIEAKDADRLRAASADHIRASLEEIIGIA